MVAGIPPVLPAFYSCQQPSQITRTFFVVTQKQDMQNLNYTFKVNDRFLGFFYLRESIFDLVTHAILTFFSDVNPLVTMRKTMKFRSCRQTIHNWKETINLKNSCRSINFFNCYTVDRFFNRFFVDIVKKIMWYWRENSNRYM